MYEDDRPFYGSHDYEIELDDEMFHIEAEIDPGIRPGFYDPDNPDFGEPPEVEITEMLIYDDDLENDRATTKAEFAKYVMALEEIIYEKEFA